MKVTNNYINLCSVFYPRSDIEILKVVILCQNRDFDFYLCHISNFYTCITEL